MIEFRHGITIRGEDPVADTGGKGCRGMFFGVIFRSGGEG